MNVIPFKRLDIYEFFCEPALIDEVLVDIKNTKIDWNVGLQGNTVTTEIPKSSYGYLNHKQKISYYNEKLFNWYQECLDKVSDMHFNNVKLSIVDAWLAKAEFSQYAYPHSHINSVVSGLLYFSDFKQSCTTFTYKDPWQHHFSFLEQIEKTIKIYPKKGKLILWRSDIKHSVQPHTDLKNTRYTMAFNTFFEGSIGDSDTGMLSLKVDSVKDKYEAYMNKKNNETM
jgi:hypothetical protein